MSALDDLLIERVFQRIADALARWISCYGIAAFLLTGFLLGRMVQHFMRQEWFYLALALVVWLPPLVTAYRLDLKPASSALPDARLRFQALRRLSLVFLPLDAFSIVVTPLTDLYGIWLLTTPALYFLACRRNPPKPRRVTVPIGAAGARGTA